jgi:hypothetical protein
MNDILKQTQVTLRNTPQDNSHQTSELETSSICEAKRQMKSAGELARDQASLLLQRVDLLADGRKKNHGILVHMNGPQLSSAPFTTHF